MEKRALGVAALLGSGLVVAWMFAIGYGHSGWLSWTILGCAVVALAGIGPAATSEMPGIGTWPLVGVVLISAWLFALAVGATPWLAWLSLAFGCAFVILSFAFTLANSHLELLHHRRGLHGHA
ncbi:MAG TPA: hypothetical protein VH853_18760 [Polyangia bacterium]|jgi:hypothetical protein|nr:hypothetical protein [Polyangia bacterium]